MNIRRVFLAGAAVLVCALATGRAEAQQIFLEIPGVAGEVVSPAAFAGQIEVLSVSLGSSRSCGGPISLSSVNFLKYTDKASVDFAIALRDGTTYPTATLRFTRADGQVYQSYQLNNARLSAFQTSGAGGDPRTTEAVSFDFAQLVVTYIYFDGSGKGSAPESMTFTAPSCP